ncbi:hypothetical protein D3Z38_15525 [Clostridiales bacterium]|nr:hypothetical protein [Clostridiales bacterium]
MKKRIRLCVAAMFLLSAMIPAAVFGASSSVSISGSGSADVGKTVTVTVTYKGSSLGYVNGQLTYDNSKLQYLSGGSSQGDAGLVELKAYADDASGKLSFHVKFKAVDAGNTGLNLETLETQNLDGDQDMGQPSASKTVNVKAAPTTAEAEDSTTEETTEETTQAATAAPTETAPIDEQAQAERQESEETSYLPVVGIGAVILILIIAVVIGLKKKKR